MDLPDEFLRRAQARREKAIAQREQPSFTCPRCSRTSHHPEDVKHSYCGHCHAYFDRDHWFKVVHHYDDDLNHYCPTGFMSCSREHNGELCDEVRDEPKPNKCHRWGTKP